MSLFNIAIFSVPRSGSSWLGQIFNSSPNVAYRFQPLFSYAFKNRINENSTKREIEKFYEELMLTNDDFVLQNKNISGKKEVNFRKDNITHLVWKEVRYLHIIENLLNNSNTIIVGLVRNPLAVINSWINAPKEFRKDLGWDELQEWRHAPSKNRGLKEEFNGFEKWKEATLLFLKLKEKYPNRFYLIKYNELLKHTIDSVKNLFIFCSLNFDKQTLNFINESRSRNDNDPYGIFKRKIRDIEWQQKLNKVIIKEIMEELRNTKLEEFLDY